MGFTIPNAAAASFIDQSEPDSVDFQVLGNHKSGVISGCAVTPSVTAQYVDVAPGEVFTNGSFKTVSATSLALGQGSAAGTRFDLVVVDSSGTVVKREGSVSANPTFPVDVATGVLTAGDVLLAAVYRGTGTGSSVGSNNIVDKRVFIVRSSTVYTGAGTPSSGTGNVGDVYINTTAVSTSMQSQTWVKTNAGWENLAKPNITVSTSAPTGGTNGDVWIQVV